MGIKNLNQFLRKNCPNIYVEKHLSNYAFKKIAIDISLYMFKYKTIFGDNWVDAFINLISCLRRNEIHCVFVYDGKAPPDKEKEQEKEMKSNLYFCQTLPCVALVSINFDTLCQKLRFHLNLFIFFFKWEHALES